jgi:hypothetical protein
MQHTRNCPSRHGVFEEVTSVVCHLLTSEVLNTRQRKLTLVTIVVRWPCIAIALGNRQTIARWLVKSASHKKLLTTPAVGGRFIGRLFCTKKTAFAKKRMVCALYEPDKGFETTKGSEIFNLCERADAVIFDWDLFNEDGKNILPLIQNLVDDSQNSVPHHVRLCVIYTNTPDLGRVANAVYEHLKNAELKVDPVQKTLALLAGATRIIVLGKPNVTGRPEGSKALEVLEEDLADRVIEEFANMNGGILPAYALHGMSSIRRNSKKILDKFHGDMDGAFLLHRALLIKNEDAFDQLPELLAEEVLSVILDEQIPSSDMEHISKEVAGKLKLDDQCLKWQPLPGRPKREAGELARMFLGGGEPAIQLDHKFGEKKGVPVNELHSAMGCNQSKAEMRLAALFNVRTKYFKSKPPTLGFGAIVRCPPAEGKATEYSYALCLMPICDGIRLSHNDGNLTSFPFWTLKAVRSKANGRGVVVLTKEDVYLDLMASGKPRDMLWLDKFKADESGMVVASKVDSSFWFHGEKACVEWVAQLKPAHAQRIAHDIGQSFSRVGVVEAEWLRLLTG